ncbi:MAG: type III pantothenate kinase [Actinomycetota bacterium]
MLLAVDVGNTELSLGVFRAEELAFTWRLSTRADRTADELAVLFGGMLAQRDLAFDSQITAVVMASVVPTVTQAIREMTRRYFGFGPIVVGPGTKTGIPIKTDNPREVGADRVVNALAAVERYGAPCIVVDFGTATTYDAISVKGEYVGGAIAPGIQASGASLFHATARLTQVELVAPKSAIGKNTVESLQSGLLYGTAAEVDGMVARVRDELDRDATTIATGGFADLVVPHCASIDEHDPWLTLEGLRLIFDRNVVEPDA